MGSNNRTAGRVTASRSKKTRLNFMADFETTTLRDDCRVWAWGLKDIMQDDDVEDGIDIDSFIERISEENSNCYFHNLKFDGTFILYWLLIKGYVWADKKDGAFPGTFQTLISGMGTMYSITVYWENGKTTEFRDSFKKLPMTIKRIAKSFALEITKGEIDYESYRPVGHKLTPEEREYLHKDVLIGAQAMRQVLNSGMKKLTVASDTLAEFKSMLGRGFEKVFPQLSYDMDSEIRRAYRGGFTYADPRFTGKVNGSGIVLDVNSLYPSVMRYKPIPYGVPEFVKGKVEPTKSHPLTVFSVTFTAKLKPDHIPCIQIKGSGMFVATEYLTEIADPTTIMVTNVDWELYNEQYDITVLEWGGGWKFSAAEGLFNQYIDKWAAVKENSTGGIREIAKLHLNSLYGKFATNPNIDSKIPYLKDGAVKYYDGDPETRPPVYTAAGVFITSYARAITIRAAQANYAVFAYADTDSLHLLCDEIPAELDVHPTRMGAWKFEYAFDAAFYIRAKAYVEHRPDKNADDHIDICPTDCKIRHDYVNRIAGLPEQISGSLTFDDLYNGHVLQGKLKPVSVAGGIVLENIPFELKIA